ncbi:MAG: hypothetical protein ACXV4A_11245 [Actinomycetes bacterium]
MTVDEVAVYAGSTTAVVKRAIVCQQLPAVRIHRDLAGGWLIGRSDVEDWAARREGELASPLSA